MAIYTIEVTNPNIVAGLEYRASLSNKTVEEFLLDLCTRMGMAVALPDHPGAEARMQDIVERTNKVRRPA